MKTAALKIEDKEIDSVVLIVDKVGVIGEALALEFSKDFFVVFVTKRPLKEKNEKIAQILFKGKIPKVPNNNYSKIFMVDDGDSVTRESAFSFISKAKLTKSPFFFLGSIRNVDLEHAGEITKSYLNSKVLVFGDLFDKEILFDRNASITKFIVGAKKDKRIVVPKNGLSLNYPISFSDSIKLILRASYADIPQKNILLFYPHPITDISLANTFQKINPEIKVDFSSDKEEGKIYLPEESSYALSKYDIKKNLEELDLEGQNENLEIAPGKRKLEFKYVKLVGLFFLACLFLFLLPLITTSVYMFLGKHELESARSLAEKGNFEAALKKTENSKTFFQIAEKTSGPLDFQAKIISQENIVQNLYSKINTGESIADGSSNLLAGAIQIKDIYQGKSKNQTESIQDAIDSFKESYSIFQSAKASGNVSGNLKNDIDNILPVIELFSNSAEVLPEALGFDKEKKYLVLFQNNLNLRPGGGRVDAVGLATVKNGKLESLQILDSDDLDKKFKIHVEPPYAIRRYLGEKSLGIKDSNFDPDFINSAISASNNYKLESKNEVDGVIAIDLNFIKGVLRITGPIKIKGYSEKVSEDNLLSMVSKNENFMPVLMITLQSKIGEKLGQNYISFLEEVGKAILEKHLLIASRDPDIQNIFTANGLSGTIIDNRKNEAGKIKDYFGISEANVSKNLANYYISRSITKEVTLNQDGELGSVATIAYKNSSQNSSDGEAYNNYIQLILPEGSKIKEISVGGQKQDTVPAITDYLVYERRGYSSSKLEIEEKTENDKAIFGFMVLIPPDSVKTVVVTYSLPFEIPVTQDLTKYSLVVYKEPGIDSYPFGLTFNLPKNYSTVPSNFYTNEIKKNEELNFIISQK